MSLAESLASSSNLESGVNGSVPDHEKMKIRRLCQMKNDEEADTPYDTATQIKKSE